MPLFLMTAKHTAENCPMHNEKTKKVFTDFMSKMGPLTKRHGIKVVGSWASMPEHLTVTVLDAPTAEEMIKFAREPEVMEWLSYQTTENRPVMFMEEAMKFVK